MKQILIVITGIAFTSVIGFGMSNILPHAQAQGKITETPTTASAKTMTFAVEKMTCAACPITVRKAIKKLDGVKSVTVDFHAKSATVIFDPAVTSSEQIGQASTNAGYPAKPAS